ncbi:hypothetical protein CBOM_07001 [Ceraceosorus bombacis]|uniref:Uncharacterized protein n=1 Tax=Ceraceosorus bombacis TaxID=401625 RepID=A0A0P1BLF3_9BASI|nr:hypothetical protein CBOM_07001 [Ceraceosorus bombacis]
MLLDTLSSVAGHTAGRSFEDTLRQLQAGYGSQTHDPFPADLAQALSQPEGASAGAVRDLEAFIHRLFTLDLDSTFFIQVAACIAVIALLLVCGVIVILIRIIKQRFWLIKITRRSEGVYIVPNALNCFLVMEGIFGCVWIVFSVTQFLAYWRAQSNPQGWLAVFNTIIWLPLWLGAYVAGWGSFYTAPGALDRGPLSSSTVGRWLPRPLLVNLISLGTPFVLVASVAPPIILAQVNLNRSFSLYQQFSANALQLANASGSLVVSRSTTEQLLEQADRVWIAQLHAQWFQGLTYTIWSVWAGLFLIFYIPAGGVLLKLVLSQVRKQRKVLQEFQERQVAAAKEKRPLPTQPKDSHRFSAASGDAPRPFELEDGPSESLLFRPLGASGVDGSTAVPDEGLTPPVTPRTAVGQSAALERHKSEQEIFFPPLRSDVERKAKRRFSHAGTPWSRYRYLRRCYINLLLLYISITIGATAYLAISALLGGRLHSSFAGGPKKASNLIQGASLAAAWTAVVFGTLALSSIFSRFFDPANAPSDDDSRRQASRLGSKRPRNGSTTFNALSPHDKTRTLPAVPESVHATFDAGTMTSRGEADTFRSHRQVPDPEEQSADALDDVGIKFSLKRDKRKPNAIFMRPVADGIMSQTASMDDPQFQIMSINDAEDPQTASRISSSSRRSKKTMRPKLFNRSKSSVHVPMDETATMTSLVENLDLDPGRVQRSLRQGKTVYYPTPFGPMPAPVRGAGMPLAPARSPFASADDLARLAAEHANEGPSNPESSDGGHRYTQLDNSASSLGANHARLLSNASHSSTLLPAGFDHQERPATASTYYHTPSDRSADHVRTFSGTPPRSAPFNQLRHSSSAHSGTPPGSSGRAWVMREWALAEAEGKAWGSPRGADALEYHGTPSRVRSGSGSVLPLHLHYNANRRPSMPLLSREVARRPSNAAGYAAAHSQAAPPIRRASHGTLALAPTAGPSRSPIITSARMGNRHDLPEMSPPPNAPLPLAPHQQPDEAALALGGWTREIQLCNFKH